MLTYPVSTVDRNAWIIMQRGGRAPVQPTQPNGCFLEEERAANGEVVPVATILLTNRECPWKCVMCDLWKSTLTTSVEPGALLEQIEIALRQLSPARHLKLYNSGSFFDKKAVPPGDFAAIAERLSTFERVIVESHPALIGPSTLQFRNLVQGRLEVAMGLEIAHPGVLQKLNKGMTLQMFSQAADFLRRHDIDLRAFILVQPPFLPASEAAYWAKKSIDFAFDNGACAATLIPTRGGNGAMERLAEQGQYAQPSIETLEAVLEYGLGLGRGRVFVDTWDLEQGVTSCASCFHQRVARFQNMNLSQIVAPVLICNTCGSNV